MRLTTEDIILSREDYLKLVRAQEEAQRIINDRTHEIETHRRLQEWAVGQAIYYTKDGLQAMGSIVADFEKCRTIQRPCIEPKLGVLTEDSDFSRIVSRERRTYEWRGEHIMGKPVFHEI